jgi:hypothetical protein
MVIAPYLTLGGSVGGDTSSEETDNEESLYPMREPDAELQQW